MRYRKLSADGDYVFGAGPGEFLVNTPEAVAQGVKTRLKLFTHEWFLDQDDGLPVSTDVLGAGTQARYDPAIQERIIGSAGVLAITDYVSYTDTERNLTVTASISTIYGPITFSQVL